MPTYYIRPIEPTETQCRIKSHNNLTSCQVKPIGNFLIKKNTKIALTVEGWLTKMNFKKKTNKHKKSIRETVSLFDSLIGLVKYVSELAYMYVVGYLPCVWSVPCVPVSCLAAVAARCVRELSAAAAELWGKSLDVDDTQPPIGHHQYRLFVCLSAGRLTASTYSCPAPRRHPHFLTLISDQNT